MSEVDPVTLIAGLEQLRGALHDCLDRLEREACTSASATPSGTSELSAAWGKLEAEQKRVEAEILLREEDWKLCLEELERERRLLAEAWERLERERLDGGASQLASPPSSRIHPGGSPRTQGTSEAVAEDAVTRAVVRQFETLRHDVRLRAEARPPGRSR